MGFEASTAQQRKVAGLWCVVCWKTPVDPAHLIPRSMAPDRAGDPLRVVPLCREHHQDYDAHALDLLPYLAGFEREQGMAVECVGLLGALQRITNRKWEPR